MFPLRDKKMQGICRHLFWDVDEEQAMKIKLYGLKCAALKNNRDYLLHSEITISHLFKITMFVSIVA